MTQESKQQTIGFIGLGAMGLPMAVNLIRKGFPVRGHARRETVAAAFREAGGAVCASAAEAASGVGVLILMLVDADQAESVLFADGALEATARGTTVILMATCAPSKVGALAERVMTADRRFIDAPVSGGITGANDATLTIIAAGETLSVNAVRPVFEAVSSRIFHVGEEPGQGNMVKTVNQLLCATHVAVAAEALALAEKMGLDPKIVFEIVSGSAASSWMLRDRGPRMLETGPPMLTSIDIFIKDLGIVLAAGFDVKAALPLAGIARQMFIAASGSGDDAIDDSQVIEAYRRLAGTS